MAELGTYYITIMPSMNKFTGAVKSAMGDEGTKAGNSFSGSFMDVLKGSALGTMVGNLATKLGSQLMSGINVGIARLDTLKNYPRVMEALGYSTGEADASVQLIMKHLDGLPTTTQDMVTLTQSIADSTGDLDLATRAALGFNDMMLANGASAGEMTQAMGVFNRVLGKGNATTAQWMSLQSVMPAQLNMVARELMGESASAESLREALNNGEIGWNDFLGAIVRLDQEGSGSVASFADQARANVDGIGTALTNLPNRIGQGWASIFDAIGRENISKPINDISYAIRDAMTAVAGGIEWLKWMILGSSIDESVVRIMNSIKEAFAGLAADVDVPTLKSMARAVIDFVEGGLKWLADNGDLVKTAIWGIFGGLSALAGWNIGTSLTALPGVFTALSAALAANPFVAVAGAIAVVGTALYGFFTQTETGRQMWSDFCSALSELWAGLQADASFMLEVLQREWESFKAWVGKIPEWFGGIVTGILAKGGEFRAWWDKSWQEAKTSVTNVWNAIKTNVSEAWGNLIGGVLNKGEQLRQWWDTTWANISTTVGNVWNTIKTTVSTIMESVRSTISQKINSAKDAISRAINAIKGLFDFHVSWPHIPLPHFSVSGSANPLDWITQGPPSFSISWYGKGGIFDAPAIIGIGEAGKEAALPMNARSYGEIARGIERQMDTPAMQILISGNEFNVRDEEDIDRIVDGLSERVLRQIGAAA